MNSQKLEDILNLSLDSTVQERGKIPDAERGL